MRSSLLPLPDASDRIRKARPGFEAVKCSVAALSRKVSIRSSINSSGSRLSSPFPSGAGARVRSVKLQDDRIPGISGVAGLLADGIPLRPIKRLIVVPEPGNVALLLVNGKSDGFSPFFFAG